METWVRDEDRRFYACWPGYDLFGPAVFVSYGGASITRFRTIPLDRLDSAADIISRIRRRRLQRGYRPAAPPSNGA